MAFMDDAQFIISQIRHSCVTSDDTGMSEIVIVNEETENENLLQKKKFGNWENGDAFDYSNSFDIEVSPMQGGIGNSVDPRKPVHPKDSKNSEIKCKTISWKDQDGAVSDSELSQVFAKKDIVHRDQKDGKKVSKLSEQIKASINQPKNIFAYYGKFDGEGYERTNKVRGFKIFLPMVSVPNGKQHASMDVCLIVDNAHVQDLIGLIMFKYTQQERKPELKGDVKSYCLLIADELDGEVDFDLPALDNKEMISKFDFKALALSCIKMDEEEEAKETKPKSNSADIIVEVCEEKRGSSKFAVNKWDLDMAVVMEKMLKKRGLKRTGHEYVLVKKDDPGTAISLEDTLDSMQTLQFQLVKRTSIPNNKKDADKDKNGKEIQDQEFFTSSQYKSFKVTMLHRFRATSEVQLGIDKKNIEIHQATQPSQRTSFLNRSPKAVTIEMDYVVDSEVIKKSGNHSIFRINYCTAGNHHDFKSYDFECSTVFAGEIVRKIELILNASPKSDSQLEYQKFKDKRTKKS